ncbi:MAG TPA: NUDIX domain-containing protein, partial [Anaerolineales bacterium]|nr:NUDIX domain-containing protein [Anaerolineales bacterium]
MLLNTICFLEKNQGGERQFLLARKKTGFGQGKVVGVGGKVEDGETIPHAAVRELEEEIGVQIAEKDLKRAARITFRFPARPEWDRIVFVYLVNRWKGDIQSSREVDPFWAVADQIPYEQMWADSAEWLPAVLAGEQIIARFTFAEDNETLAFS